MQLESLFNKTDLTNWAKDMSSQIRDKSKQSRKDWNKMLKNIGLAYEYYQLQKDDDPNSENIYKYADDNGTKDEKREKVWNEYYAKILGDNPITDRQAKQTYSVVSNEEMANYLRSIGLDPNMTYTKEEIAEAAGAN